MNIRFLSMALGAAGCFGTSAARDLNISEEMFPQILPTPFQEPTPAGVATPYRWIHLLVDVNIPTPGPRLMEAAPYSFPLRAYGYPHWIYTRPQRLYWLPVGNDRAVYFNVGYEL